MDFFLVCIPAILSLVAVIRPAPFKQQRHAGSGQSLIMCECLSTLSRERVEKQWKNRSVGGECWDE